MLTAKYQQQVKTPCWYKTRKKWFETIPEWPEESGIKCYNRKMLFNIKTGIWVTTWTTTTPDKIFRYGSNWRALTEIILEVKLKGNHPAFAAGDGWIMVLSGKRNGSSTMALCIRLPCTPEASSGWMSVFTRLPRVRVWKRINTTNTDSKGFITPEIVRKFKKIITRIITNKFKAPGIKPRPMSASQPHHSAWRLLISKPFTGFFHTRPGLPLSGNPFRQPALKSES